MLVTQSSTLAKQISSVHINASTGQINVGVQTSVDGQLTGTDFFEIPHDETTRILDELGEPHMSRWDGLCQSLYAYLIKAGLVTGNVE